MIALTPSLALTLFLHPVIGNSSGFIVKSLQVNSQLPKPDHEGEAQIYSGFRDKLSWAGKLRDWFENQCSAMQSNQNHQESSPSEAS